MNFKFFLLLYCFQLGAFYPPGVVVDKPSFENLFYDKLSKVCESLGVNGYMQWSFSIFVREHTNDYEALYKIVSGRVNELTSEQFVNIQDVIKEYNKLVKRNN